MRILCAILIAFPLAACGNLKRDEKKKLDDNTITLSPAPGTYDFKPWVKLVKKENGLTTEKIWVKAPGDADFKMASGCAGVYEETAAAYGVDCVEITQSGTLAYYLKNENAQSDEQTAEYVIAPTTNDVVVESRTLPTDQPTAITLSERETFCTFTPDGTILRVIIQTTNDAKLTADRYAYVALTIASPAAGATTKVTSENDFASGIDIKPTSDQAPGGAYNATYATDVILKDAQGKELTDPTCTVTAEAIGRSGVSKGSFTCSELGTREDVEHQLLGGLVGVSGNWQCDRYN